MDSGNQLLLLHGLRRRRGRPRRIIRSAMACRSTFCAFVVSILIFGVGAGLSILEGLDKIEAPIGVLAYEVLERIAA